MRRIGRRAAVRGPRRKKVSGIWRPMRTYHPKYKSTCILLGGFRQKEVIDAKEVLGVIRAHEPPSGWALSSSLGTAIHTGGAGSLLRRRTPAGWP